MPCFKGLAVSIHTPEGPLPEHAIQKQSRASRISSYIPVPPPKIPQSANSNKPEQSTFAISITLLTPGLDVPYSQPKPSPENPFPRPRQVGSLPSLEGERGSYSSSIAPYLPLTASPNETIAAYIYFDGRSKEEVATLLRRGEETWVNSRWVSVPDSEGGGLAEREFLFREVGLERWLNGLDLEGKDAAAKVERRRMKMEKKRRRRKSYKDSDEEDDPPMSNGNGRSEKGILRYGTDRERPLEETSDSDEMFLSDSESDDDPVPESAGQIKIALFRVLASGEIKRGEYSPQFDAHDDDDDMGASGHSGTNNGSGNSEEVDHTTSFAKPKTLDPKSISTQTVTGIDPPDRPFAVFTYLYRGEKQLQKMGILPAPSKSPVNVVPTNGKRRSIQADLATLKPLKPQGLMGFSKFRDPNEKLETNGSPKSKDAKRRLLDADSDEDEDAETQKDIEIRLEADDVQDANGVLSAEDANRQRELAQGVQKIRLKRQHSADLVDSPSPAPAHRNTPPSTTPTVGSTPPRGTEDRKSPPPLLPSTAFEAGTSKNSDNFMIGSPLKKQRSSLPGSEDNSLREHSGLGLFSSDLLGIKLGDKLGKEHGFGEPLGSAKPGQAKELSGEQQHRPLSKTQNEEMEEEL